MPFQTIVSTSLHGQWSSQLKDISRNVITLAELDKPFVQICSRCRLADCSFARLKVHEVLSIAPFFFFKKYLFRQNTYLQNKKHTLACQGGTGCYRFNYQPGSKLEGVGDTPPPQHCGSAVILCSTTAE